MSKFLQFCTLIFLIGCSTDNFELNGNWVIHSMSYQDHEIYPNDLTPNKLTFNIVGYEGTEKLEFQQADSTLVVPGFDSEEMILNYELIGNDSVEIFYSADLFNNYKTRYLNHKYEDTLLVSILNRPKELKKLKDSLNSVRNEIILTRGSLSKQYSTTKQIYCGTYRITKFRKNHEIILKSSNTEILLLSEKYLTAQRIDELFEGL